MLIIITNKHKLKFNIAPYKKPCVIEKSLENYIKDQKRYESDVDYKEGWLAGESEGKKLQAEAVAIGKGAASGYPQKSETTNLDDVAKEALQGVDTSSLKNLE